MRVYISSEAFSRFLTRVPNVNNTTEIAARYIIHIRLESHIGFWSSGYDGFWRVTSLPRFIPRALSQLALFIVTSHLCMNPRDSIVTYTWRTTPSGRERFVLSERKSAVAWMEVGLLGQSGNRWHGSVFPGASHRLLKAKLPFFSCF